jgi:magnesium transporter
MVERFTQGKVRWVNMKNPTVDEIHKVMADFDIPPQLMTDITTPVPKNSAFKVGNAIKITLDFPVVKRADFEHPYEVKFIVLKNALITTQYEEMEGLDRFRRQFEVTATLRKNQKHLTGAHLFISLFNNLYESSTSKLDHVESKLAHIEDEIFRNNERQMVAKISEVSKKLITFRHVLHSHEDIFRDIRPLFEEEYKNTFTSDIDDVEHHYLILQRRTNTLFDTLTALRETNTAMLTTRQNEIIKNLTLMAFITFPLTLLSSMFGMNVTSAPIIGKEGDFWVIVAIMFSGAAGLFVFFKRRGWI